jgi:Protein of unknown function (DUF3617)
MRTTVLAAAIVSSALAATVALAVDLPARKPGLWEVTLNLAGGKMPPRVMKFCTDAETDAALYKLGMNAAQGMCRRNDIQRSGNIVTMDSECKLGDVTLTSHAVMTFTGDAAYHTDIQSHFNPPMAGHSESSMTQEAKWAGACPADMQPGDMTGPNGMKMNLKSVGQ